MADMEGIEVEGQEETAVTAKDKGKAPKSGKRFEIKKWNAVAMWSWAICTDTCAICRNNLYEPSIEYQANPTGKASVPMLCLPCPALCFFHICQV
jgi:E3 ubiquitin-protein ligase RBX1